MLGQINNHRTSFLRVSGFPRGFGPDSRSRLGAPGWGGGCCAPRLSAWALAPTPRGPPPWARGPGATPTRYGPGAARRPLEPWLERGGCRARTAPRTSRPTSTLSSRRPNAFTGRGYAVHDTWSALCLQITRPPSRARPLVYALCTPKTQLRGLGGTCTQHVHVVHITKHPAR